MEPEVGPPSPPSLWTGPREDPRRYRVDLVDGAPVDVGGGGEGLVFQAHIRVGGLEHPVALKMHTNLILEDFGPFTERVRALAGIGPHPHLMRLIDAFVGTALIDEPDPPDDAFGIMYTVADWVPGMSLPAALEATSKASGLRWVAQVARAADYLHGFRSSDAPAGLVHRDIKPSNVRVTPDEQAVLIDFGIARPHQEGDHTLGAGTYLWRAPEVIGGPGEPGPASDAWGLGALAYWVLLAESPRLEGAAAARELLAPAAKSAGFADPKALSGRIANMLETHPQRRPTDLSRWADDIEMGAAGRRPFAFRRLAVIAAVAVVLAGAATFAALRLGAGSSQSPSQSRQLAADAERQLPRDTSLGSLLGLASYTRAPTDQAAAALVKAMEQPLEGELHDSAKVTALAYDRDGDRLVSADTAGHVIVWNTSKGVTAARFQMSGRVTAVAINPTGTIVVAGNATGVVDLWPAKVGAAVRSSFPAHDAITSLAFDPSGTQLAVGTADTSPANSGTVILWNLSTDTRRAPRPVAEGATASSLAFDPADPTMLVIGAGNGALDYFYSASPTHLENVNPTGFGFPVTSVVFDPEGTMVAAGDNHGHVQLWSAQEKSEGSVPHDGAPVTKVTFSPDGTTVSVADTSGAVTQYGVASHASDGDTLVDDKSRTVAVAMSADGRNVAGTNASGTIALWSTEPRFNVLAPSDQGSVLDCVAYSQTGDLLATSSYAGSVDLWNADSGREMALLPGTGQIHSLALDHNGTLLATGDNHGHVVVWNTLSKKVVWRATAGRYIRSLAFSPNEQWLAAGDSSARTTMWRAASGKQLRSLPDPRHRSVQSVAFSPTSTMLATGDQGGDVTLWSPITGRRIGGPFSVATMTKRDVQSMAFSPDATSLAVADADGSTTLLAVPSGTAIRRLFDASEVLSVAYSRDGRTLVTGDHDGIIRAWDPETGAPTGPSRSVGGQVYSLAFSADGSTLASANNTQNATLVPSVIETETPAALDKSLCRRVGANLTRAEWNRYVEPRTPYQKVCPAY